MSLLPSSRPLRIALLVAVLGFVWLLIRYFDSDRSLRLRQGALVEWARSGSPSEFEKDFAASDYHDQWGHTPADVLLIARGIRLAHPDIKIAVGEPRTQRTGDTATVTQKITVTGTGERIDTDFHFTWRKESIWPGGWRLQEVTAPGFP